MKKLRSQNLILSCLAILIVISCLSFGFSTWALTDSEMTNLNILADAVVIDSVSFTDLSINPKKLIYDAKKDDDQGRVTYTGKTEGEKLSFKAYGSVNKLNYVGYLLASIEIENPNQKTIFQKYVKEGYIKEPDFEKLYFYEKTSSNLAAIDGSYWISTNNDNTRRFMIKASFGWGSFFNYMNPGEFFDSAFSNNIKQGIDYTYDEINEILGALKVLNGINYTVKVTAYPRTYDIVYDSNGGTTPSWKDTNIMFNSDYTISDIIPINNGYTFVGWSDSKDGGVVYESNDIISVTALKKSETNIITLYAIWAPNDIQIVYNDGNGNTYNDSSKYNSSYTFKTVEQCNFASDGFSGWKINEAIYLAGSTIEINDLFIPNSSEGLINLVAVYNQELITITYKAGLGIGEDVSRIINKDDVYTIESFSSLKYSAPNGFVFKNWINEVDNATYIAGNGYQVNSSNFTISSNSSIVLTAHYIGKSISITFNGNGGLINGNNEYVSTLNYNDSLSSISPVPKLKGYTFKEWNTSKTGDGISLSNNSMINDEVIPNVSNLDSLTLFAIYIENQITIKFEYDKTMFSLIDDNDIVLTYSSSITLPTPEKGSKDNADKRYRFNAWKIKGDSTKSYVAGINYFYSDFYEGDVQAKEIVLVPDYDEYFLISKGAGTDSGNISFTSNGKTIDKDSFILKNSPLSISLSGFSGDSNQSFTVTMDGAAQTVSGLKCEIAAVTGDVVANASSSCILPSTLILMSDYTYKEAGEISPGDKIISLNHENGKIRENVIIINDDIFKPAKNYRVIDLYFSNGNKTSYVYEHGFFDVSLNKYVYFNDDNFNDFLGHKFLSFDSNSHTLKITRLINVNVRTIFTKVCSPVSANDLNIISDNMLSIAGGLKGIFNIFEYEPLSHAYNKRLMNNDIEKYGLLPYEYYKDYFPIEIYNLLPCKYMSVALNKGLITQEKIDEYINKWKNQLLLNV